MELCMRHQGGQLKRKDCWWCKSKEEQNKILRRIFNERNRKRPVSDNR